MPSLSKASINVRESLEIQEVQYTVTLIRSKSPTEFRRKVRSLKTKQILTRLK